MIRMSTCAAMVAAALAAAPADGAEKAAAGSAPTVASFEAGPRFNPVAKPGLARGEKVFVEYCAVCHGLHGKGDGPRSAFFADSQYIPDLTTEGFLAGRDEELRQNIRNGLARYEEPALVMPQFRYILGSADIDSVVAYVKTLAPPEKRPAPKMKSK